jgi:hypothetical protein
MFTIDELAKAREKLVERAITDGHVPAIMAMLKMAGMDGTRPNPEQSESAVISAFSNMTDAEIEAALAEDEDE